MNHTNLAKCYSNNDSQLLAVDALVIGSVLLGIVNPDHWAIAIPLSKQLPALSALFSDDLPRGALVSAAISVVDETITKISNLSVFHEQSFVFPHAIAYHFDPCYRALGMC